MIRSLGRAAGIPWRFWALTLLTVLLACETGAQRVEPAEVGLAGTDAMKLSSKEERALNLADARFKEHEYREAVAHYAAFCREFPRSAAIPYALVRKGRATQYDRNRYEAIRTYNDVLDYFADQIAYAAPALFYVGECHMLMGNTDRAFKTWKELADDKDYRRQPIAGYALNALAGRMLEQGQAADAAAKYLQSAVEFRELNPDAACQAIGQLVRIDIAVRPDVKALREACTTLKGFSPSPGRYQGAEEDYFWNYVREQVNGFRSGTNTFATEAQRKDFCDYWGRVMEAQRPQDDDLQIEAAALRLTVDGKRDAWIRRLDAQFAAYQKPDAHERIVKWIEVFSEDRRKAEEYYAKLTFATMRNDSIQRLLLILIARQPEMGKSAYGELRFDEMDDKEKAELAMKIFQTDKEADELAVDLLHHVKNADFGRMAELRLWYLDDRPGKKSAERGLPFADRCILVPAYAKEAYWMKGVLLCRVNRFEEAIKAFRASDDLPRSIYAIVDCYAQLGKIDEAVTELRQIENFFVDERPRARLKIADVYEGAGKRDLCVQELRIVLDRYPESTEASMAHRRLQAFGIYMR